MEKFNKALKMVSNILKCVFVIFIILLVVILAAVHGWRLFGFKYCVSPDEIIVDSVGVNTYSVIIESWYLPSMSLGVRNPPIYKIEGNTLKVGYGPHTVLSIIFGGSNPDERKIPIPEGVVIDKVILCGGGDEEVIWTR